MHRRASTRTCTCGLVAFPTALPCVSCFRTVPPRTNTHGLVHTTEELKMTGNCLMGSRPLLLFDKHFDAAPELRLIKALFKEVFAVPLGHPKSKPFVDHVMSFFVVDGKIWIRNYQISERGSTEHDAEKFAKRGEEPSLTEIGPRMVLEIIRIFDDSFTGKTLYENPNYVSPTASRSMEKKKGSGSYAKRMKALVGKCGASDG